MTGAERILAACRCESVDATPIWFMRQAGRCLPEYRALLERSSVIEIATTPELCAEVSVMPVEALDVDAAVMFADIMLPLGPMGVSLELTPQGPIIDRPIRSATDVDRLGPLDPKQDVGFVLEAIRLVRRALDGDRAVIGIAGAPFTLACYLIEGGPSRDYTLARRFMYAEPTAWHRLMDRLATALAAYVQAQAEAGAQVVQLFDSWVGALGPGDYTTFVAPYSRRVLDAAREVALPTIHFGTGTAAILPQLADAGGDVIGIDARQPLAEAWRRIGPDRAIQGNLEPVRLVAGWETTLDGARVVLDEAAGRPGHIFNLGHALRPDTDPALMRDLVAWVHETTAQTGADRPRPTPASTAPAPARRNR